MLSHANLPKKLWAEAVATAAYIRNHTITSVNGEQLTPFENGMATNPTSVISRYLGVRPTVMSPIQRGGSLTKRLRECALLATVKIQRVTD